MAESPSELQAEIEKLERKHAENPEGRYFVPLANAYRKLGAVEHAEALLRAGLKRHPEYLSAHIVLGRCLADRQDAAGAVEEFRYVLSLDPQNLIALRTLGELASQEGRVEEAARWYQDLLAVDPMNEDARRALEGLRVPVPEPEPQEEFQAGHGWWEPPAREDEEPADGEPLAQAEPGPAEAAPPERAATEADEGFELGYEVPGTPPAWAEPVRPEEPQVEEEAPGEDAWAAAFAEGDAPPAFAADGDAAPDDTPGSHEVVTETIAELYLRQGFRDRAIEVYRELVRRRGGDPALEARLAALEGRPEGSGAGAEPLPTLKEAPRPPLAPPPPPADELPDLVMVDRDELDAAPLEGLEYASLALDEEETPGPAYVADVPEPRVGPAAPEAPEAEDAFALSFSTGFAADAELIRAVSEEPAPEPPAAGEPSPSIREFLVGLLAWAPGAGAAALPEAQPAGAGVDVDDLLLVPTGLAEPGSPAPVPAEEPRAAQPEPEAPRPGAGPADDTLFPWETPSAPAAGAEGRRPAVGGEPVDMGFSFEEFMTEEPVAPAPAGAASRTETPSPGAAHASAAEPAEEEDDLESFQAWLRSLKR